MASKVDLSDEAVKAVAKEVTRIQNEELRQHYGQFAVQQQEITQLRTAIVNKDAEIAGLHQQIDMLNSLLKARAAAAPVTVPAASPAWPVPGVQWDAAAPASAVPYTYPAPAAAAVPPRG